jgi:short-subunit dehydrogenase
MTSVLATFKDSTALITGASSGIGQGYAKHFASLGINLILTARNQQKLIVLADELTQKYNVNIIVIPLDLSKTNAAQTLFEEIQNRNLVVNILINNAGFGKWTKFLDQPTETYNEMVTLNISNLTLLCHLFLPQMLRNEKGIIINLSSTGAFQPLPYIAVYGATKSYVLHFTEALAGEYRSSGIQCLAVCPGNTDTNFTQVANADTHGMSRSSVEEVVLATITALDKGKSTMIVGCRNYLTAQLPRVLSRKQVIKLVGGMLINRLSNNSNASEIR